MFFYIVGIFTSLPFSAKDDGCQVAEEAVMGCVLSARSHT